MNNKSVLDISSDGECGNLPIHAATPWSVYAEGLTIQIDEGAKPTGRRPCVIGWQGFDSNDKNVIENLANAALICKAVNAHDDLLAALEAALLNDGGYDGWKNQAHAAIAKATP